MAEIMKKGNNSEAAEYRAVHEGDINCLTLKCNEVLLNVSPFWFEVNEQLLVLSSDHPKKNLYQVVGQGILRTRYFRK